MWTSPIRREHGIVINIKKHLNKERTIYWVRFKNLNQDLYTDFVEWKIYDVMLDCDWITLYRKWNIFKRIYLKLKLLFL